MSITSPPTAYASATEVVLRAMRCMRDGSREDLDGVIHPDFVNREARDEPPASRGRGPAAIHATALWLRDAYAELDWEVHDVVAERDLVVLHCTMSGRQVGTFVLYDGDGRVREAFPPTGRRFASTQTHWFRLADGKVILHWANRDDMATAAQLGWIPPTPEYVMQMAEATERARREQDAA